MIKNKRYEIIKRVKVHTSPLVEVNVINEGVFIKETKKCYIFDCFKVKKELVIQIKEITEPANSYKALYEKAKAELDSYKVLTNKTFVEKIVNEFFERAKAKAKRGRGFFGNAYYSVSVDDLEETAREMGVDE